MIRPNIKTYHEDLRLHRIHPSADHQHFLGRSALDLRRQSEHQDDSEKEHTLFEMELAMPGFSKEDISITILDDLLTIKGKKKNEERPSSHFLIKEFDVDIVERKFKLDDDLVNEKVRATYRDGMVKIIFTDIPTKKIKTARKVTLE